MRELEKAILVGRTNLTVHSFQDVPVQLEPEFTIAVVLPRVNPFDTFLANRYDDLDDLPEGAVVGTSSLHRQAKVRALRPDVWLMDLSGNVNARLGRPDADEFDAIAQTCAGLERLGYAARIRAMLLPPRFLPAVAQSGIAIECRSGGTEVVRLCAVLHDHETDLLVRAKRAINRERSWSSQVPMRVSRRAMAIAYHCSLVGDAG